jgi:hypothetical protein
MSRNREAIDAISVTGYSLQLIEMHSHHEIAARYLGRIGPSSYDRSNNHRFGGSRRIGVRGDAYAIPYL